MIALQDYLQGGKSEHSVDGIIWVINTGSG